MGREKAGIGTHIIWGTNYEGLLHFFSTYSQTALLCQMALLGFFLPPYAEGFIACLTRDLNPRQ